MSIRSLDGGAPWWFGVRVCCFCFYSIITYLLQLYTTAVVIRKPRDVAACPRRPRPSSRVLRKLVSAVITLRSMTPGRSPRRPRRARHRPPRTGGPRSAAAARAREHRERERVAPRGRARDGAACARRLHRSRAPPTRSRTAEAARLAKHTELYSNSVFSKIGISYQVLVWVCGFSFEG